MLDVDSAQRAVVEHDGGPLLVLGSPGTGKSTALTERWTRLAQAGEPHRVLLLVAKRDRALELRDVLPWRLEATAIVEVAAHTWHALAYHLVTRYYRTLGYSRPPILLNTNEQWTAVSDLLASEEPGTWGPYRDHLSSHAFTSEVADFCVRAGHRGLDDAALATLAADERHRAIATFALRYRQELRSSDWLDYAELISTAERLLASDTEIRDAVRTRFPHVLVDDAHELAPAQLGLLRRLGLEHVVCAGDPDSAIEAFRGADPSWLDRFSEIAPDHERVVLDVCHRFGDGIGAVASRLISTSEGSHRATSFEGPEGVAAVRCYSTMAGEIESAAREIRSAHLLDGVAYEDMAILLAQPSTYTHPLKRVLDSLQVPYQLDSGDRALGAEPAVRTVLDLCRLALEPPDDGANLAKAVLGSQIIGLRPQQVRALERAAYTRGVDLTEILDDEERTELDGFRCLRDVVRADPDETADATFARLFEASDWTTDLVERRATDHEAAHQVDALVALGDALGHFVERRSGGTMLDYLASSADAGFAVDTWQPARRTSGVHILSFHASKGRTFEITCILGVAEGQIPRAQRGRGLFDPWALEAGTEVDRARAQLDEERRTFYVALTRARQRVIVSTSPGTRRATPSRFIGEAFGETPDPIVPGADQPPLTLDEAAALHRRTLADTDATGSAKAAAAAALASIPGLDPASWWWRRDLTEGAPLTPEGKLTTSYSRIGRYDNCPLQYVLESVLGLDPASTYQMKFGSLVHKLIERSDPASRDIDDLDEAIRLYTEEFKAEHKDDYPNLRFARTYFTAGVRMLKLWWKTERSRDETVDVEYAFDDLDFEGHTIRGRIDRVARSKQGLVLTDYKTSRSALSYDEAAESLQLAIYYHAAKTYEDLRSKGEPVRMQLVYPGIERRSRDDGSVYCDRRTQRPQQAEEALGKLRTYLADAAAERFAPSPEADCRWCRMKPLCPRWPEGHEIPR